MASNGDSDADSDEKPKKGKQAIQYRSNINGILQIMQFQGMTEDHLSECIRTPFYRLWKGIFDRREKYKFMKKSDVLIKQVIDCFSSVSGGFVIGGKDLKITELEIKILLGIECGQDHLPKKVTVDANNKSAWYRRMFGNAGVVNLKLLSHQIETVIENFKDRVLTLEAKEDIAKLLSIYTVTSLCLSKRHYQAKQIHISVCEDLESIKKYNWAGEMKSYMFKSIRKCTDTKRAKGGVFVLLPWLFEHVKDMGNLKEKDAVPRCLKWEYMLGAKKINVHAVQSKKVRSKELKPTTLEEGWIRTEDGHDQEVNETEVLKEGECSRGAGEEVDAVVGDKTVTKDGVLNEDENENVAKRVSDDEDVNVDSWMNDRGDGAISDIIREDDIDESKDNASEETKGSEKEKSDEEGKNTETNEDGGREMDLDMDLDNGDGSAEEEMLIDDNLDDGPPRGGEEVDKLDVEKEYELEKEEEEEVDKIDELQTEKSDIDDLTKIVEKVVEGINKNSSSFNEDVYEGEDSNDPVVMCLREKLIEAGKEKKNLIDEIDVLRKEKSKQDKTISRIEEILADLEKERKEKKELLQLVETLSNQVNREEIKNKELEDAILNQQGKLNRLREQVAKLKDEKVKLNKEHMDISTWYNECIEELEKSKKECENLRAAAALLESNNEDAEKGTEEGDDVEVVAEVKTNVKRRRSYRLATPGSIERNVKKNNRAAAAAKSVESDFVEEPRTKRVKVTMKPKEGGVGKTTKKKVIDKKMTANVRETDKEKDASLKKKTTDEGGQIYENLKWDGKDTVDEKDYNFLLKIKKENLGDAIWWDKENELLVSGKDAFALAHKGMVEVQVIEAMLKMVQEEYGVKGGKYGVTHQSAMSMSLIEHENVEACQIYISDPFYKNSQDYAFTLLPVFVQDTSCAHWSLLVYSRDNKEFYHYNSIKPKNPESIGSKTEQTAAKYRKFLVQNVLRKIKPGKEDKYIMTNVDCIEQEPGSVDCGVFVILWCYAFYRCGVIKQKTYIPKYINEGRAMIIRKLLRSKYSQGINKEERS